MKKILLLTLLLLSATMAAFSQAASYAGGDGTKDNPYLISNADELKKLAADVAGEPNFSRGRYFRLTADIMLNADVNGKDLATLQQGKAFPQTPTIGTYASDNDMKPFQGVFDGGGHTISGVYLQGSVSYLALFRVLDGAEIRNLGLVDLFVQGNAYFAGIAARVFNSRIINCYVERSQVRGYGSNGGGIAGQVFGNTRVQNCYVTCTLAGKNDMGGIVGRVGNGDVNAVVIENCYCTSTITTSKSNKAGITATNSEGSTVRNCYYTETCGTKAVWADKGTTEDCRLLSAEEMAGDELVAQLNSNARQIPAACQWVKGDGSPRHNYAEVTPDDGSRRDVSAMATDPQPADGDTHADMEGAAPELRWEAARDGKTVSQLLFFGTDSVAVSSATRETAAASLGKEGVVATLATGTAYRLGQGVSPLQTYYWRVDRIDGDGQLTRGDVWQFVPRRLAFKGAEGYGRFARGGRGGKVVYVTNLSDAGEGSLRWALTNGQGPRTVLFKVSGIIDMGFKTCWVDDQVTIAGQTAPGKGVCIRHSDIGVGSDNIVRFLRARRGLGTPEQTGNAIGTVYSDHTILDHVTASWGTDETFSSRGSRNITFQRSMISEALGIAGHRNYDDGKNHGFAATIGGDIGTFSHNLLADCSGRNWSMGGGTDANGEYAGRLDIFNNVVYNWQSRTTDGGAHEVNFVNNYYKMGHASKNTMLFTLQIEGNLNGTQSAYVSGNIRDNMSGVLTNDKLNETYCLSIRDGRSSLSWEWLAKEPFFPSYATIEPAVEAYKSVLSDVGANQPEQDLTDQRMVSETLNRTYTYTGSRSGLKGQIDNEADAGGFELYPEQAWGDDFDSDLDGLPDWWEELRGLNTQSAADDYTDTNADLDGDGYTELDRYLDFLAQQHCIMKPGETLTIDLKPLFAGYTKQPVFAATTCAALSSAAVNGSVLTIKAGSEAALGEIAVSVKDADGSSYERRLCIAVTQRIVSSIETIGSAPANGQSVIYDLTGRRLQSAPQRSGLYIQQHTDASGHHHSKKLISER